MASFIGSARSAIVDGRAFRRDPLAFILGLGTSIDILRFRVGLTDFTLVNHPDLVRRVLVTDSQLYGEGKWTQRGKHVMGDCLITLQGGPHHRRRALVNPSFELRRIAEHASAMVRHTERLAGRWRSGEVIDAHREMGRLAITMAGDALFDEDLAGEADELLAALSVLLAAIPRLPLPRLRVRAARRRVARTAARLTRGHLVPRLRAAGLNDAAVRDEVVSLLIAAIDTTPRGLAWTWFLLGRHPAVELRMHDELAAVLGGRAPVVDDLARLPFLERILNESLRLYPPVHFIDRRPVADVELGGERLRAGSYLLLSPLVTQRDPRFFDDPGSFRPERWGAEDGGPSPARLSFPFGAGPHGCVGERLARLEMSLALATLAQRWRLRPSPELPTAPSPQTQPLRMILEPRG